MPEAARLNDAIGHSHALEGLIGGTILGGIINAAGGILSGMLFAAGVGASCVGVGFLLIGASIAVGFAANALGDKARDLCVEAGASSLSPSGNISSGSHNVFINSRPAAASTLSSVACDKHSAQKIAQGSDNVFINGLPAARKQDKTTCDATITEGSSDVLIGGGTVATEEIESEIPHWAYVVSDLTMLAAGLVSFGGGVSKGPGAIQKLFSKLPGANKIRKLACIGGLLSIPASVIGILLNPVDVTSGQKFLNDDDELDFTLESELPLFWQRNYLSSYVCEGVLGRGWSLFWETSLQQVEEGILWRNTLGDTIPFPALPSGHQTFCPDEQCWLTHHEDGTWTVHDAGELIYHYPAFDNAGRAPLSAISDNVGNRQSFHYNSRRQMTSLHLSDGQSLRCEYHPVLNRLVAVWQPTSAGDVLRVRYRYSEAGFLIAVQHRGEAIMRRFGWNEDNGLMLWHENASGLRCTYEWQLREDIWCVTQHHTSEGNSYSLAWDEARLLCTATYQDGSQAMWQLDEKRRVSCHTDRTGNEHYLLWDDAGQLAGYRSALGHVRQCRRDVLGRLESLTDEAGATTRWYYHHNSERLAAVLWPDGTKECRQWDEYGRLVEEKDRRGQATRYYYPHAGTQLPERITDAREGVSQLVWNRQGQLTQYTDCSGQSTHWQYDALGQLLCERDALNQETRYRYNAAGFVVMRTLPDGSEEHLDWSAGGLLLSQRQSNQPQRHWRYNARGQVLSVTDRLKRSIYYQYDSEGHLLDLHNANGGRYRFVRDAEGRLLEEQRPDNMRYLYRYDADGQVSSVIQYGATRQTLREIRLTRDATGRVTLRETPTEQVVYHWSVTGQLMSLTRTPTAAGEARGILPDTVAFRRDTLGRITHECSGGEDIEYQYDIGGNLATLILPEGDQVRWMYYGSGHAIAVRFNGQTVSEFDRDALHREVSRTQGSLTQQRRYDRLGRRVWQSAGYADIAPGIKAPQGKVWRKFGFNAVGELTMTEDGFRGVQHYRYDAESRLLNYDQAQPQGGKETFSYDRADNIFGLPALDWTQCHGGKPEAFPSNRLPFWRFTGFVYDDFGNLIKRTQGSLKQQFKYDDENRLLRAWGEGPEGKYEARYEYDVLGRRKAKHVRHEGGETISTRFRWQGMRLLQELCEGTIRSYVYDPNESYTPLARVTQAGGEQRTEYFHTDLNGAPLDVTDREGNIVWCGKYRAWGKLQPQVHLEDEKPALPYQPLRYPGQYCDDETGLHYSTFRYYDPEVGRFTTQDPIGLLGGMNLYQYAPNPLTWVDPLGLSGDNVFIHYTNQAGFEKIMNTEILKANNKGKVYITDLLMSPQDVMRDVLINNPKHAGRGDYAFIFKVDSVQKTNISLSSRLEYIHEGDLRLKEVIYSGKNPYSTVSNLDYNTRLKMTDNQVKARRC